jgi:hypothetical protein
VDKTAATFSISDLARSKNGEMVTVQKVQDPRFVERVLAGFARQSALKLIGASMPVVEPGYTEIYLPSKTAREPCVR